MPPYEQPGMMDSYMFMTPGYYVGWFTLALLNAGLAQSKKRSGMLWFLVSLFLGPLATFLLVTIFSDVSK
jgi:hypothetical protein